MQTIVEDLGLPIEKKNRGALFSDLNRFLLEQLTHGNNVVLIFDEAQNLSRSILEQIRRLSNLEADNQKLLQIILVGQPELREKLKSPALRQLRQRISVRYHMGPLEISEVGPYIAHRLNLAGANGTGPFFAPEAVHEIFQYSKGIPRLINVLCDKSLLTAFVSETKEVNAPLVRKAIEELEGGILYEHHSSST